MADARKRLVDAGVDRKDVYVGDRAVAGLGKNYMTEASRLEGIATYTLHLRRCVRTTYRTGPGRGGVRYNGKRVPLNLPMVAILNVAESGVAAVAISRGGGYARK